MRGSLPVISENHASAYSWALKEKAKEEAKALIEAEGGLMLAGLVDNYVNTVLLDGPTRCARCSTANGAAKVLRGNVRARREGRWVAGGATCFVRRGRGSQPKQAHARTAKL